MARNHKRRVVAAAMQRANDRLMARAPAERPASIPCPCNTPIPSLFRGTRRGRFRVARPHCVGESAVLCADKHRPAHLRQSPPWFLAQRFKAPRPGAGWSTARAVDHVAAAPDLINAERRRQPAIRSPSKSDRAQSRSRQLQRQIVRCLAGRFRDCRFPEESLSYSTLCTAQRGIHRTTGTRFRFQIDRETPVQPTYREK
jgi:hypothetical protein